MLLLSQLYLRSNSHRVSQGVRVPARGSFYSGRRPQKLCRFNFLRDKSPTGTHDPLVYRSLAWNPCGVSSAHIFTTSPFVHSSGAQNAKIERRFQLSATSIKSTLVACSRFDDRKCTADRDEIWRRQFRDFYLSSVHRNREREGEREKQRGIGEIGLRIARYTAMRKWFHSVIYYYFIVQIAHDF